ncbi:HEPN domain-containing protein [Pseudomonas palleroniana]|uniref:HEPN domain-containing protein n=1 Tax=Pseudomonas palleroniana TaxID=191390 RepID=UPI0018E67EBD|nr:hypothetical protein [Pseudomonas palleroniana]
MEKQVAGLFFGASNATSPIEAHLQINKDGSSLLLANDVFSDGDIIREKYLLGEDAEGRCYSILNAHYKLKVSGFSWDRKSEIMPDLLLVGKKHVKNIDDVLIASFSVKLECRAWLYESVSHRENGFIPPTLKMSYLLKYDDLTTILLESRHDFNLGGQVTMATFSAKSPQALKYFQDAIHCLVTFLSFACRSVIQHGHLTFIDVDQEKFEIYYRPAFYPGVPEHCNSLFNYRVCDLQERFTQWCNMLEKAPAIFKLYFLGRLSKLDNTVRFLMIAQALECFHRIFTGDNDSTFITRVRDVLNQESYRGALAKLKGSEKLAGFDEVVRGTRNYFTHYNEKFKDHSDEYDLIFLTLKVELLVDLYLLSEMGFSAEEFDAIQYHVIDDRFNRLENMSSYMGAVC